MYLGNVMIWYSLFSQDADGNEEDNSKEFFVAVKYEADLEVKGYVSELRMSYKSRAVLVETFNNTKLQSLTTSD